MLYPGDLVKATDYCPFEYFIGKVGIVTSKLGQDYTMTNESGYHHDFDSADEQELCYYRIMLSDGKTHVFSDRELLLLSRAKRNENR